MVHLTYNPSQDDAGRLEQLTCGASRLALLDQLMIALRAEVGARSHQHHLIVGPRGSGKTHLLHVLFGAKIVRDPQIAAAYLPVVLPEETPLRSPADVLLKVLEHLAVLLDRGGPEQPTDLPDDRRAAARSACLEATGNARTERDPRRRQQMAERGIKEASAALSRIVLAVVENLDSVLYLGPGGTRKLRRQAHWALRRYLQDSSELLVVAAAPTLFGAVQDHGAPFYGFFRVHTLPELSNDEVLDIIRRRLDEEVGSSQGDPQRARRVEALHRHFADKAARLRGVLAITGGLPRYAHLVYDVLVETDVEHCRQVINRTLDQLTPYFQQRLDPRVMPEAEIDVLHTLALADGPQRPTELADATYGTPINEITELLNRLQQRGYVRRASTVGRSVRWDLTEPMFRVWARFRHGKTQQDQLVKLAEFVAAWFTLDEIEGERKELDTLLRALPSEDAVRRQVMGRKQRRDGLLAELRGMASEHAKDAAVREQLANGLFNTLNHTKEEGDLQRRDGLLDELRGLASSWSADPVVQLALGRALVTASGQDVEEEAKRAFDAAERLYVERDDDLGRGFCLQQRAYALQRQLGPSRALDDLEQALHLQTAAGAAAAAGATAVILADLAATHATRPDIFDRTLSLLGELKGVRPDGMGELRERVLLHLGRGLLLKLKAGELVDEAPSLISRVVDRLPRESSGFLRPLKLATRVLTEGEEKALAREPEEMRRVVRLLLESKDER